MSLFKRSLIEEILTHAIIIFLILLTIWTSILLMRFLGEAVSGSITIDLVLRLMILSTVAALPTILVVTLFLATLTAVNRTHYDYEMIAWFSSGLSPLSWFKPVSQVATLMTISIALSTFIASPWALRQISEYRGKHVQNLDLPKIAAGRFVESKKKDCVFLIEEPYDTDKSSGKLFARFIEDKWFIIMVADSVDVRKIKNGDHFLIFNNGHKYEFKQGMLETRLTQFDQYGFRIKDRLNNPNEKDKKLPEPSVRSYPTLKLLQTHTNEARSQIMWRASLPIAALNLAFLAVPLGTIETRLGYYGGLLMAGLISMVYMNLINLFRAWIASGKLGFNIGTCSVHILIALLSVYMTLKRLQIRPTSLRSS